MIHFFYFHSKNNKNVPKRLVKLLKKTSYTNTPAKKKDGLLLDDLKQKTESLNKNNLTRTKAYLSFYNKHPDIHWAFLAHMVSRNTGWNMTDLKGSLLPELLTPKECQAFYSFLEWGNWLIFRDVYPQLLLYEASSTQGRNLFYLLEHLQVSVFMKIIWDYYYENKNPVLLTTALIINEQNHLEIHAMNNDIFQSSVFNKPEFTLQDILSMNQIIFPYIDQNQIYLSGKTIHHFESLTKRIMIGKQLYSLLYSSPEHLKRTFRWANETEHTGSRTDFWPHMFHTVKEEIPGQTYIPRLSPYCSIKDGAPRLYSPILAHAWKNKKHHEPKPVDWYKNQDMIRNLSGKLASSYHNIEDEFCATLGKLELAIMGKDFITSI